MNKFIDIEQTKSQIFTCMTQTQNKFSIHQNNLNQNSYNDKEIDKILKHNENNNAYNVENKEPQEVIEFDRQICTKMAIQWKLYQK